MICHISSAAPPDRGKPTTLELTATETLARHDVYKGTFGFACALETRRCTEDTCRGAVTVAVTAREASGRLLGGLDLTSEPMLRGRRWVEARVYGRRLSGATARGGRGHDAENCAKTCKLQCKLQCHHLVSCFGSPSDSYRPILIHARLLCIINVYPTQL